MVYDRQILRVQRKRTDFDRLDLGANVGTCTIILLQTTSLYLIHTTTNSSISLTSAPNFSAARKTWSMISSWSNVPSDPEDELPSDEG